MDLDKSREEIDKVDALLTQLFETRMQIVAEVAAYKKKVGMPVFQTSREKDVILKNTKLLKDPAMAEDLRLFFEAVMNLSKARQKRMIEGTVHVGYQGVEGAFSYIAATQLFRKESDLTLHNYETFEDVFVAITENEIDYGVIPIENSSTGAIIETIDLVNKFDFYIQEEIFVRAEQNLLGTQEADIEKIQQVFSHPQGFAQTTKFLAKYPNWELIPFHNTAVSARHIANMGNPYMAAIASKEAADLYGLKVLADNIVDNRRNYTRFIKVGRSLQVLPEANKVSILFAVKHISGSLTSVLQKITEKNLNMLNLESRPIPNRPWEYYFYLDLEGNLQDADMSEALRSIEEHTTYYKILGCYSRGVL